ncbi:MAG: FAD-dependent oxidoreductase, partial [bacterium]|nr:FAD-dependent oxidoreductase [bacterium]
EIKKIYILDHRWGKLLYFMNRLLFSFSVYTEAHLFVARKEQITHSPARFSDVLWGMCTGDEEYRGIFKKSIHPALISSVIKEFFLLLLKIPFKGKSCMHLPASRFHKLLNTHRVVIIGGGPAGAACAIKLAREAKEKKLDIEINLYEGKDFKRHHNQCVGILSPPLLKIMEEELAIRIPMELIKSEINGYQLVSDKETIFLENYRKNNVKTYSVRRSEFDHFLMSKAEEHGVKVINSRVINIEFFKDAYHDEVRIFSESNYVTADVVVCAFGLDREMLSALNNATGKRFKEPPKVMKTFITRFDFPPDELHRLYDRRIYAFLISPIKRIKFGAITVKDDHVVVNIAGENANSHCLQQFLYLKNVHDILPNIILKDMKWFCGRFPSAPARHPYGDRYVAVGDTTGWLRPLKGKGINLAVITGINAAVTMVNDGLSKADFDNYKHRCREFIQDYKYGMFVNMALKVMLKFGLLNVTIRLARKYPRFYNMLYDSVSAENSYKNIIKSLFKRSPKTPRS